MLTPDLRRFLIGIAAVALVLLLLGNLGQLIAIGFRGHRRHCMVSQANGRTGCTVEGGDLQTCGRYERAGLFAALLIGLPVLTVVIENRG